VSTHSAPLFPPIPWQVDTHLAHDLTTSTELHPWESP